MQIYISTLALLSFKFEVQSFRRWALLDVGYFWHLVFRHWVIFDFGSHSTLRFFCKFSLSMFTLPMFSRLTRSWTFSRWIQDQVHFCKKGVYYIIEFVSATQYMNAYTDKLKIYEWLNVLGKYCGSRNLFHALPRKHIVPLVFKYFIH